METGGEALRRIANGWILGIDTRSTLLVAVALHRMIIRHQEIQQVHEGIDSQTSKRAWFAFFAPHMKLRAAQSDNLRMLTPIQLPATVNSSSQPSPPFAFQNFSTWVTNPMQPKVITLCEHLGDGQVELHLRQLNRSCWAANFSKGGEEPWVPFDSEFNYPQWTRLADFGQAKDVPQLFLHGGRVFGEPAPDVFFGIVSNETDTTSRSRTYFMRERGATPRSRPAGFGFALRLAWNPHHAHHVLVLDRAGDLWRTTDAGVRWTNATGDLKSHALDPLHMQPWALSLHSTSHQSQLLVLIGTQVGVFYAIDQGPYSLNATLVWTRLGAPHSQFTVSAHANAMHTHGRTHGRSQTLTSLIGFVLFCFALLSVAQAIPPC